MEGFFWKEYYVDIMWKLFWHIFLAWVCFYPRVRSINLEQEILRSKWEDPEAIYPEIYNDMFTYAHLIDISYCITSYGGIREPFDCPLECSQRYPNMSLIYQFHFDNSVGGYISTTTLDPINCKQFANDKGGNRKYVIVSLRGTRSIYDFLSDVRTEMTPYSNEGRYIRSCGPNCKIHKGFSDYYENTLAIIESRLDEELSTIKEDYEILILGHSLGGAVALLLALHYLDKGYTSLALVTMGQPLVGNADFTNWVDEVMSSHKPVRCNYDRKYMRIIHKEDLVSTIPLRDNFHNEYCQFNNQIYINCSSSTVIPPPQAVIDCHDGQNIDCIKGDFNGFRPSNYYQNHNTYFRHMGLCQLEMETCAYYLRLNVNFGKSSSSSSSSLSELS